MTTIYELLRQMEITIEMVEEYINKIKNSTKIAYDLMKDPIKYPEGWQELIKVAETMRSEDAFLFGTIVGSNYKKFFETIFQEIGLKKSIELIKDIGNKYEDNANDLVILLGIVIESDINKYNITTLLNELVNIPNDIYKGLLTGVLIQSIITKGIDLNLLGEFVDIVKNASEKTPKDAYLRGVQIGIIGYTEKLYGSLSKTAM